ncbi:hypothetical protein [Mesorhizobium sp. M2A.F.Ca.ET.037.01.1.1]|uniref:hypothetical protein n=1 Tax=Mesorhizobium sp. M2A.F.Ca.ET.037.01.1.1 TaxID=2496748 RepID=UPI001677FD14|nr:hypothetical protein [Mesorhizobium sp. M2A.F.Ca.ET.037.01.1.1]
MGASIPLACQDWANTGRRIASFRMIGSTTRRYSPVTSRAAVLPRRPVRSWSCRTRRRRHFSL